MRAFLRHEAIRKRASRRGQPPDRQPKDRHATAMAEHGRAVENHCFSISRILEIMIGETRKYLHLHCSALWRYGWWMRTGKDAAPRPH